MKYRNSSLQMPRGRGRYIQITGISALLAVYVRCPLVRAGPDPRDSQSNREVARVWGVHGAGCCGAGTIPANAPSELRPPTFAVVLSSPPLLLLIF